MAGIKQPDRLLFFWAAAVSWVTFFLPLLLQQL
jgi:hypothetical protein